MKYILISIFSLFLCFTAVAQDGSLNEAVEFYKAGKLEEAKVAIDKSGEVEAMKKDPNYWYLKGFIYKDLYKASKKVASADELRKESVQAFILLVRLPNTEKYHADAYKNLKYIASTYYNEAVETSESGDFNRSKQLFESFKTTHQLSQDHSIDMQKQEIDYFLALGSKYSEKAKNETDNRTDLIEGAKESYQKVLNLDKNNLKGNYNMGVLYYNEAVNLINKMDYDEVDLVAISQIEDQSIDLFKQSLPYMELALEQDPNDRNVLEGLAGIYFSLRDYEKSNTYKAKMEALDGQN